MLPGPLITVGLNTIVFYVMSEILPGFEIKNKKAALGVAVLFSVMAAVGAFLVFPITAVLGVLFAVLSVIPFIGAPLAASGALIVSFGLTFVFTAVLLKIIDAMMESFKMQSNTVVLIAAFLMAVFNTLIYTVLF